MKSSELIQVPDVIGDPIATETAFEKRDTLILEASNVLTVKTEEEANAAAETLKNLKGFTRSIETARKEVKSPIVDLGRQIDSLAKSLVTSVTQQASRIGGMIADFQAEEARKRAEAERKAREEEARIKAEAEAKMRKAEESGRNVEKKVERIQERTFQKTADVRAVAATAAAPKVAGLATRKEVQFQVTDIAALHAARPELVTLQPNTAAIKAILKACPSIDLPGLRHWTENKTVVR